MVSTSGSRTNGTTWAKASTRESNAATTSRRATSSVTVSPTLRRLSCTKVSAKAVATSSTRSRQAFRDAGIKGHRRNIELLAKGLINHVRLTKEVGDYVPDDIVTYQQLERSWKPRPGSELLNPNNAIGRYLERPYLHYSIGTKIRPSMLQDFRDFGIAEVETHDEEPPFQPEMIRGMSNLQHDPDWITRMFGSGLKTGLLKGVHRGATSDPTGTSFVPGLARGVDFGHIGKVQSPKPFKLSEDAKVLRERLEKQALDPWSGFERPWDEQSREGYLDLPFQEPLSAQTMAGTAYESALPEQHGYNPAVPTPWNELSAAQQQQYINSIAHAQKQLQQWHAGLDRDPSYGGSGHFSWGATLPAIVTGVDPIGIAQFKGDLSELGNYTDEYTVPVGSPENRGQYALPAYGEEISDWTSSGLNPWGKNPQPICPAIQRGSAEPRRYACRDLGTGDRGHAPSLPGSLDCRRGVQLSIHEMRGKVCRPSSAAKPCISFMARQAAWRLLGPSKRSPPRIWRRRSSCNSMATSSTPLHRSTAGSSTMTRNRSRSTCKPGPKIHSSPPAKGNCRKRLIWST